MKSNSLSGFFRLRLLLAVALCAGAVLLTIASYAQNKGQPKSKLAAWPTLADQLTQEYEGHKVQAGSALEKLIRENQDFSILREDERADQRGLPAWLRVWWRKAHSETEYKADDPTGGYPRVLHEILEWMLTHQDLKSGPGMSGASASHDEQEPDATVGPDQRISGPQSAPRSESDIRINYFDMTKIISASNNISGSGVQSIFYSTNGGASWSQSALPLTSPDGFHSDPTVEWTSDSRAWSSTLGISGGTLRMRNYYSMDNGASWTLDATVSGTQTSVDKQMVWVDHSAASPYQNQMYAIWHNGSPAYMNRRTAGPGGTWLATPIRVSGAESTGTAIGDDVKTNSAGDVFGAWPTTSNKKIFVVKSTDGGNTFGTPVQITTTFDGYDIGVPSFNNRRALIYVTLGTYRAGAKNNVYATWADLSGESGCTLPANEPGSNVASACKTRIWFARSTDGGATWSTPIKINNQASNNDQFNQWLAVDETTGTIGIMYYDTVADAGRKKTDVWYQSSTDDGVTWTAAVKVTTGTTDETVSGADGGNQYGDYNGLSGYASMFFPSWTDRRNNAKEEVWTVKVSEAAAPAPHVVSGGATVVSGSCSDLPPGTINPGQRVTVSFCVQNNGTQNTANLVGTLQATGGVTNPSASQSYGIVTAGGPAVCRTFSFTPTGACGSTITATMQMQDGATALDNLTFSFTLGIPNISFSENFDGVSAPALPANWVATNISGGAPLWTTSASTPDDGINAAFVDDPAAISDKQLESPQILIGSAAAKLTFRNNYVFEGTTTLYDGGVLEVSSPNINGGAYTDITNAAVGGSFASGGYAGTLSTGFNNPLAGRAAWGGASGGYINAVVNLGPNLAGQTAKFRFRMGSDSSNAGAGWRIDTLSLQDGSICAPIPLSAVSRKVHGGAGNFDLNLSLTGAPAVEPRSGGANGDHQIVVTFAAPISASGATLTSGTGGVSGVSVSGAQAIVNLTGVTDAQTIALTLNGVSDGSNMGCVNIPVSFLLGDTNGNGTVNATDVGQTKEQSGQPLGTSNFLFDVNASGAINATDVGVVKSKSGNALP